MNGCETLRIPLVDRSLPVVKTNTLYHAFHHVRVANLCCILKSSIGLAIEILVSFHGIGRGQLLTP
jgi:hypothetical protein